MKGLKNQEIMARDQQPGGAVAKPLGELSNGDSPTSAVMVLPVFKRAVLIPSTMQGYRAMRVDFTDLERFLIWLAEVDDLDNPGSAPPAGCERFLIALQRLNNPEFRKTGWNNDFESSSVHEDKAFFADDYKYSPDVNPGGAGWLQQIWLGGAAVDQNAAIDGNISEVKQGWNTAYYLGGRYFLRNRHGVLVTNEQMICRWPPGGPGPGPGTRVGPPRL
ncbi:hypothetical protein P0136_10540 [Lentisphaerota bacterium ZTH]|nr:hypothetical protein JYG24_11950 [Lentisphaerota bacterium]WET05798.1 hypothetical protein P0136_10540 [Lentisphaerota bacterium ZTH]